MASITVPGLPFPLGVQGEPACVYSVQDGGLTLTGAAGSAPLDTGRLVGPPPAGDFTLAARVRVQFSDVYDAGALLLYAGARRWAKLAFEYSPQRRPTAVTVVTRGSSDDCNGFEPVSEALWLRVTRSGRTWAFHGSEDGKWWRLLRYFDLGEHEHGETVHVGFLAQSPSGSGCTALFDRIGLSPSVPTDLRDGS